MPLISVFSLNTQIFSFRLVGSCSTFHASESLTRDAQESQSMGNGPTGFVRPLKLPQILQPNNSNVHIHAKKASDLTPWEERSQKISSALLPKSQHVLNKQHSPLAPRSTRIVNPRHNKKTTIRSDLVKAKAASVANGIKQKADTRSTKRPRAPESEHRFVLELRGKR